MPDAGPPSIRAMDRRPILRSLLVNGAVPALLYWLGRRSLDLSEVAALSIAAVVPAVDSLWEVARRRRLDVVAVVVLLGIGVSMVGVALGGSPRILLIRESLFTGALGAACFLSLLLPRPLMFYFARQFNAGGDPERVARFNARWQNPAVRRILRLITVVWGLVFSTEFAVRVVLVLTLPPVAVLAVAPVVTGAIVGLTMLWTFAFVRRRLRRVIAGDEAASAAR
jgi:hypothetical protein